jgi:hypothetical protein
MRGVPYGLEDAHSDLPIEPVPKAQAYPIGTAAELWLVQASTASNSSEVTYKLYTLCTVVLLVMRMLL